MSKRELVLRALHQQKVERVPVGFWFHFITNEEELRQPIPEVIERNIAGHQTFIAEFQPDFVKLMSDGFFYYPNEQIAQARTIDDLKDIQSIGKEHPWIQQQVALVREQKKHFLEDIAAFYNIFAPATYFKWQLPGGEAQFAEFLLENPELTQHVLNVIAEDISHLVTAVLSQTDIDGIYLSVQNVQDQRISSDIYARFIRSSDLIVLEAANRISANNILHICGYEGATNDLSLYQDYPSAAVNWAVGPEQVSLIEGKNLFDRTVIGGFDNTANSILYHGNQTDIQQATQALLEEAGEIGIILGADCTVPSDTPLEHLQWVREVTYQ
ncbi:uroporphyrinogen decarboxylase family protein [Candidatus Enterococcus ferrettii]|uniref:Uroporphyrinogen decarboxylase (URO-D) domain-containing protein n=1 Tax=Candidatus Enterococcus ferrettii TaxID=2815324 RepID=A0ABV0ENH6_9ENTE|nr:uroporphyrinogen decarboxylase family protein [Enterococcus sp. 665A]MBO1338966.1 uroporphyrinogen decarboxylase [Enterococcus sp. 665A]